MVASFCRPNGKRERETTTTPAFESVLTAIKKRLRGFLWWQGILHLLFLLLFFTRKSVFALFCMTSFRILACRIFSAMYKNAWKPLESFIREFCQCFGIHLNASEWGKKVPAAQSSNNAVASIKASSQIRWRHSDTSLNFTLALALDLGLTQDSLFWAPKWKP